MNTAKNNIVSKMPHIEEGKKSNVRISVENLAVERYSSSNQGNNNENLMLSTKNVKAIDTYQQ